MRALHVIDSLRTGGAEILLKQICEAQVSSLSVQPSVYVCCSNALDLGPSFTRAGVPLYRSGCKDLRSPFQILQLARHFRKCRYDIIHAHLFPAQLWVALAADLTPTVCPIVTTEHSTWNRRRKPIFRPMEKWMYCHFGAVICISDAVRSTLVNWIGSGSSEFQVVQNGIDLGRFASMPSRLGADRNELVILSVGSLCSSKDHATLLRAFARVESGQLVIVGDGELRNYLLGLCVELNIRDRVHFLGCREDVPELMASANVYVQPSRVEGFGLAPLEAMAAGLPVITSDAAGMREMVEGAGLTFPVGNVDALALLLQAVLSSSPYRTQLSDASRKRASLFSIDKTVSGYKAVYDKVLAKRSRVGCTPLIPDQIAVERFVPDE